jgi:hypothetical protein
MLRAVQAVRPALDKFYAALSDEQKQRFNALDEANQRAASGSAQKPDFAKLCGGQASGIVDASVSRIGQTLRLEPPQEQALAAFRNAGAKADGTLAQTCSADQPLTPTGRLAAMERRLDAMRQAIDTVQPAFAGFYQSLSDEQKAQLNRMGPRPT